MTDSKGKLQCQGSKRFCKSCGNVTDPADWAPVMPIVITQKKGAEIYWVKMSGGKYECSKTGLRLECSCTVTLQYQLSSWDSLSYFLETQNIEPCGPLMDITIISGHLEAIHLPHCICLGSGPEIQGNMYILHEDDQSVDLEGCELSRFHAKRLCSPLSKIGAVIKKHFPLFKVHCEIMVYRVKISPLQFHVYLLPCFSEALELVKETEKSQGGVYICKPGPENSFRLGEFYRLETSSSCSSCISPEERKLSYSCSTTDFFEVQIKAVKGDFDMLFTDRLMVMWETSVQKADYTVNPSSSVSEECRRTVASHEEITGNVHSSDMRSHGSDTSYVKSSQRSMPKLLLDTLNELEKEDFKLFKWHLKEGVLNSFTPISKKKLEDAATQDVVDLMRDQHGRKEAGGITVLILTEMGKNSLAQALEDQISLCH